MTISGSGSNFGVKGRLQPVVWILSAVPPKNLRPDFILLHIGLPKLKVLEAANRIRLVASGTKILFVTQNGEGMWCGQL